MVSDSSDPSEQGCDANVALMKLANRRKLSSSTLAYTCSGSRIFLFAKFWSGILIENRASAGVLWTYCTIPTYIVVVSKHKSKSSGQSPRTVTILHRTDARGSLG